MPTKPKPAESHCPNCGYCPTCGRSNQPYMLPYYPWAPPYWVRPYGPYWVNSPTITYSGITAGTANQSDFTITSLAGDSVG